MGWAVTDLFTGAVEAGASTFIVRDAEAAQSWRELASVIILVKQKPENGSAGHVEHATLVGDTLDAAYCSVPTDKLAPCREWPTWCSTLVVDTEDSWSIIPAENLVAALQSRRSANGSAGGSARRVLLVARSADDARTLLAALEVGVDGVVLRTNSIAEVREALKHVRAANAPASALQFQTAHVTRVEQLSMGDRVCVDLCAAMAPGEGILVGNFCRALFLAHSECTESAYINSRPFRVNAGPVHAYCLAPGGSTAYLSELRAGSQVIVAGADGSTRTEIVGRCKVEKRPLILIEAVTSDGLSHSVILQNAETVKLVGPGDTQTSNSKQGAECVAAQSWEGVPVSQLREGQQVLVHRLQAARHMGHAIQESLTER